MSIKNFIKEVEKGLKSPVYLLYSEEPYLLGEAALTVKKTIPEPMRDFSFDIFDVESDETFSLDAITDILRTVPFGGGRRVVVIENLQKAKEKQLKRLREYISKPAPESLLMLLYKGALKKTLKEGFGALKAIPLVVRESDLPLWIKEKARENGIDISDGAADYIIVTIGTDLGIIASELAKLTLIGKNRPEKDDIKELIRGALSYDAFDLIDALKGKDTDRVMKIYKALSEDIEPYSLLGALNWHYEKNADTPDEVFALLNNADIKIKTSGGAYPLEDLLVRLLKT